MLGNAKYLPASLRRLLHLAKNAQLLQSLPDFHIQGFEEEKDLFLLLKYVKKWLTLKSIDMDAAANFFSESTLEKVKAFQRKVEDLIQKVLETVLASKQTVVPVVEKYRTASHPFVFLILCFRP